MMPNESGPRSMSGAPILGHRLTYNIYVDEAGISPSEPVRIVAAVVVDTSKKWREADAALRDAFLAVPPQFRDGFIFHAKSIWVNEKYRKGWDQEQRTKFLKDVMSIPRRLKIPVAIGKVRRDDPATSSDYDPKAIPLSLAKWQHGTAFSLCIERADFYLRTYCSKDEVATVICEDFNDNKDFIRFAVEYLQEHPHTLWPDGSVHPWIGREFPLPVRTFAITQVIDTVHFVEKGGAPLLQLADACAFAFRRFCSGESYGADFVEAVVGSHPGAGWLDIPQSGGIFRHEERGE